MIKTAIKHYIYDFALNYLGDKYIKQFVKPTILRMQDINNTHLHSRVKYLSYANDFTLEVGKKITLGRIVDDMCIVSYDESLQYRGNNEIEISKKYDYIGYYVRIKFSYEKSNLASVSAFPISNTAELILE